MVPSEPTWHVSRVQKRVSKFVQLKLDFLLKFPGKYLGDNSPDLPTYRTNLFHRQTRCDAQIWCKWLRGAVCNLQEPWISSGNFINSNWPHPDRQMDGQTYISTPRAASSTRESGLQQMNTLPNAKLFKTIKSHDFIIYSTIDPIIYSTTIYHYSILCTSLFQFTCEQCVSS